MAGRLVRIEASPAHLDAWARRMGHPLDSLRAAVDDYRVALDRHLDAPNDLPTAAEDLGPRARRALDDGGDLSDLVRGFAAALRHLDGSLRPGHVDVAPGAWGRVLDQHVQQATVSRLVVDVLQDRDVPVTSLDAARRHLTEHPALVDELLAGEVELPSDLQALVALQLRTTADDQRLFADLDPTTQGLLGVLVPRLADDDRAPFASRIGANHLRVVRAAATIEADLAALRAEDERRHHDWVPFNEDDLDSAVTELEGRADLYAAILDDGRQLLLFDDTDDGRIIELHGTIGPDTEHVGILVPGTGATLGGHEATARRARSFVAAADDIAMVSWLGGDMPDSVSTDAPFNHYSKDNGPVLAAFSQAVRREIDATAEGSDLTVIGHSYGGATVGRAELDGLDADRILHVSSAGAGAQVSDVDDYPVPDRDRYALTDDDDPIQYTQGANLGGRIGHGADPDRVFVALESGDHADGTEIDEGAHSAVFTPESDAWANMLQVITGGQVMLHVEPTRDVIVGHGHAVVVETPNDPEPLDID